MMGKVCTSLIVVLIFSVSAYAQEQVDTSPDRNDDYLLSEWGLEDDFWELDFLAPPETPCMDVEELSDLLLDICLWVDFADEDMYEVFPEVWEVEYEFYLFWDEEWPYCEE